MAVMYQHDHRKPISCEAVSQMLSNQLYYKRFFPFYAFNLCAGLDSEGKGAVYSYDAVGSFERCGFGCQGSGAPLLQLATHCLHVDCHSLSQRCTRTRFLACAMGQLCRVFSCRTERLCAF